MIIIIILVLILLLTFLLNMKNKVKKEDINFDNNLYIYNNFYSNKKLNKIKKLLSKIQLKDDIRVSSRKSICLYKDEYQDLYNLIYNDKNLRNIIKSNFKKDFINNPDFPIEYREYPNGSSGMRWHSDLSMFNPDCLEVVLTIENNSDSKFMWNQKGKIKSIKPESNTLVIVKPNTVSHRVSEVNGNRTILKFIIQFKNSIKKESFYREIKNCPK
jgi:hypothetical protein